MKPVFIAALIVITAVFAGLYRYCIRQLHNVHQQPPAKKTGPRAMNDMQIMSNGLVSTHLLW